VSGTPVRPQYEGLDSPTTELKHDLVDIQALLNALRDDPANGELHEACWAKVAHAAHLTNSPEVDPGIRKAARGHLMEATRWLASLDAARPLRP